MYRTMEARTDSALLTGAEHSVPKEDKKARRFEALLDLTETIATVTVCAGFLLLVAACLAAL